MNWTPGPARCRSDEYEAEIAFTDMEPNWPYAGRYRKRGECEWELVRWNSGGLFDGTSHDALDLMPPRISREALAKEVHDSFWANGLSLDGCERFEAVVAHVIEAVKSGRVE